MSESMKTKSALKEYRTYLSSFCYYLALINLIGDRVERGELTGGEFLADALDNADFYREKFLAARQVLGLPADSSALEAFTGSFSFFGFALKEGRFEGNPDKVEPILDRICDFQNQIPTPQEALKYEVAVYAYMCAKGAKNLFVEYCGGGKEERKRSGILNSIKGFLEGAKHILRKLQEIFDRAEISDSTDDWDCIPEK